MNLLEQVCEELIEEVTSIHDPIEQANHMSTQQLLILIYMSFKTIAVSQMGGLRVKDGSDELDASGTTHSSLWDRNGQEFQLRLSSKVSGPVSYEIAYLLKKGGRTVVRSSYSMSGSDSPFDIAQQIIRKF